MKVLDVLDQQLKDQEFIIGNTYSIADMAIWPWYGQLVLGRLYTAGEFLDVKEYKNVLLWAEKLDKRPPVSRGRMVNRLTGNPKFQLHERHDASDFEMRNEAALKDVSN